MNNSISEIHDVRIEHDEDTRFTASDRGMPFLQRPAPSLGNVDRGGRKSQLVVVRVSVCVAR